MVYMSGKKEFLATLRHDYDKTALHREDLDASAIKQFEKWFDEAVAQQVIDVNAMTVSTVSLDGMPSARIVLLRSFDERGFVFYTNYQSHKARDLSYNPKVCLSFFWPQVERQVRITGLAERQSAEESDAYFALRPRGSRLGAWASPQSQVIASREVLEQGVADTEARFGDAEDIPRPSFWGGFVVRPLTIEFWQGRPSRLHDRFRYDIQSDNTWAVERLAP